MEFGKLNDLSCVDWSLPNNDPLSLSYWAKAKSRGQTKFYVGAPAWGRKEWLGRIYPLGASSAEFLFHYARNFNCIELNTTHYRIPSPQLVQRWLTQVPKEFCFCPKMPQSISHALGGLRDRQSLLLWWEALEAFGPHLGPSFLQLPPGFDYGEKAELFALLKEWPSDFPLAIELRHPSWFTPERHVLPALVEYLQSRQVGLVITDVAGRRDVSHSSVSAPFVILRFIGNDLHVSDLERLKAWSLRLKQWQSLGLNQMYFMVHQPDDIHAPEMADAVIAELNATCSAELTPLARPLLLE